jgi:hypothetical protein
LSCRICTSARPALAREVEFHRAYAVIGFAMIVLAAVAGREDRFVTDAKRRRPALSFAFAGEPEPVQLAEDGAPREAAAKARCEFGAREALAVKRLQPFDRLFAPDESQVSPPLAPCRSGRGGMTELLAGTLLHPRPECREIEAAQSVWLSR